VRGEKLNTKELRDVVQQCRAETHIAYLIANLHSQKPISRARCGDTRGITMLRSTKLVTI